MKKVYLYKGDRFQMVPAIVKIGDDETTKSLTFDHESIYNAVLKGLPIGHAIVVGRYQADRDHVHPVIVEQGSGKYFYDADTNLLEPTPEVETASCPS